jgi:CRP/FNR family cyclic AMP-dependent transcriptional regulator
VTNPSLLGALPPETAEQVRRTALRRAFGADQVILREGEVATSLHVIVRGRVAVMLTCPHGHQLTFLIAGPGEFVGEPALLAADQRQSWTVRALEPAETLSVRRPDFESLLGRHPQVGRLVAAVLAERVRRLAARLQETVCLPVETRVRRRLVDLVAVYDGGTGGTVIPLTQEELAGMVGTVRGTVNRVLRQEEALGSLLIGRHRLTVLDPDALARRAAAG